MKNIVKLLSVMLVAGTMLVSCTEKPDTPVTPDTPTVYTVQVNTNDATLGTATISPLKSTYTEGDTIVLTATPADGAKFLNWNGNITDNPYTYVVKENITFTANFEALPQPTFSATFNGSPLGMNEYDAATAQGIWLFQAADHFEVTSDGTLFYFPALVLWMQGTTTTDLTVMGSRTELYYQTYYSAGQNNYGDYQFKSLDNMNCTLLDLTTFTMSMTAAMTMYDLGPIANGTAATADECPTAPLAVTLTNMVFTEQTAKANLTKFSIVK